ncbi:hypothetical protein NDU88_001855 [Pleurodeles waltl]|uniref:Uncharacterized protein n=1 Tax=Pleurodeles waltl TaxID=8319 RepID=A0AAV7M4B9_PLEWA|nr:hypothetical protein NDU88_001855 [Pleurodeles waltl]
MAPPACIIHPELSQGDTVTEQQPCHYILVSSPPEHRTKQQPRCGQREDSPEGIPEAPTATSIHSTAGRNTAWEGEHVKAKSGALATTQSMLRLRFIKRPLSTRREGSWEVLL